MIDIEKTLHRFETQAIAFDDAAAAVDIADLEYRKNPNNETRHQLAKSLRRLRKVTSN